MMLGQVVIFLLALLVGTAVPAYADDLVDSTRPLQIWKELCTTVDCDKFPKGYSTYYANDEFYYFPLAYALRVPPDSWEPSSYWPMGGTFQELDEQGRVLREVTFSSGGFIIPYCCKWLLEQTDLASDWPRFVGVSPGFPMHASRVSLERADDPYVGDEIQVYLPLQIPVGDPLPPFGSLDKSGWISLNDDFWLIHFEQETIGDPRRPSRKIALLSKRPMFNGRHVFGQCSFGRKCDFRTVAFPDPDNIRTHLTHFAFSQYEYQPRDCDDPNPVLNCDEGLEFFEKIGPSLQVLEDMFDRIKIKPRDVEIE